MYNWNKFTWKLPYTLWIFSIITCMSAERVYMHSNLARTFYAKMLTDDRLKKMDLMQWYEVNSSALLPLASEKFLQLEPDEETHQFLASCFEQADWVITQIWQTLAKAFLGIFLTQTSVNGLLNRGRMFVWSRQQARSLLGLSTQGGGGGRGAPFRLALDLGAGDGHVTQVIASMADEVHVTEVSAVMRRRLRRSGYRVLDAATWTKGGRDAPYDVITCLNLLDRCDAPVSLLKDIRSTLAPAGVTAVAVVLPFAPFVETGAAGNVPSENLGIGGVTLEEQVNSLVGEIFPHLGFELLRWSKLPYLCEGDLDQTFYWLTDVIFVLRRKESSDEPASARGIRAPEVRVEL